LECFPALLAFGAQVFALHNSKETGLK
jgi:hypothetical protein